MADVSSNPVVDWGGMMAGAQLQRDQSGLVQNQAALAGQQAQAASMQNQLMKARLPLIMKALSDYSDGSSNTSGDNGAAPASSSQTGTPSPDQSGEQSPETSWYNPAVIDSALRSKFFVPPYTPQEAQRIQAAALSGDAGLTEYAKSQRQIRVDQQTAQSQYGANNLYEAIHTVVDADPGTALAQLAAIAPDTAKRIKEMIPDEADEDAAARAYAAHVGGTVHQYTGREVVTRPDGTYIDKITGRAIPGVEKSGLSEDQWANLAKAGMATTGVPDGQGHIVQTPQWRLNGAPSLDAWVMQMAAHGGEHGAQPTVGGAPKAVANAAAAKGVASAQAQTKSQPQAPGGAVEGVTVTNGQPDPVMSKALTDSDFKYVPPRQKFGTSLSDDEQKQKTAQTEKAIELKQDVDKGIPATQNALTFYRAAQDILDSKGANTGKWNAVIAKAGQWVPGLQVPATTNYQEMAKYLGNAALQSGKQLFPKMTQKEGDWLLNKLNPSPDMNEDAVRNMLNTGTAIARYSLDSAGRIGAYLRSGGDATRFNDWNSKYWALPDTVVGKSNSKSTGGATTAPKYSEAQVAKWAQTHGVPVDKARALFGMQ
jgi:hypothetical protein